MLSNRCINLLLEVIGSQHPLKIGYLSGIFNVSPRTIRYDLDEIDYYLAESRLMPIRRKTNVGVYFTGDDRARTAVLDRIAHDGASRFNYSPAERQLAIVIRRCLHSQTVTIESMAAYLGVSISTILKDLQLIREKFLSYGVSFSGFRLQGDEANIRDAICGLFMTLLDKRTALGIVRYLSGEKTVLVNPLCFLLFEKIGSGLLGKSIEIFEKYIQSPLSDERFIHYSLRLSVQIGRISREDTLCPVDNIYLFDDNVNKAVSDLRELWQKYNIELCTPEANYLMQTIEKTKFDIADTVGQINMADLQVMAICLCEKLFPLIGLPVVYDKELTQNLIEELPGLINRGKMGVNRKQNFVRLIEDYAPQLTEAVKKASSPIMLLLGRQLYRDELAAIAICFLDYLERSKTSFKRPRVILFGMEHDISMKLVRRRLEKIFAVEIVAEMAAYETGRMKSLSADYVISLHQNMDSQIPCLLISPFLTKDDLNLLKIYLPLIFNPAAKKEQLPGERLFDVISQECICLDYEYSDFQKVINKAFEMLHQNDYVTEEFLEDLYATVNDIGLQSVLIDGVMFLHSRNFTYSKRLGLSIIRLANPLYDLKLSSEHGIRFVITLSTTNSSEHMRLLTEIVGAFHDENKLSVLENSASPQEIKKMFHKI